MVPRRRSRRREVVVTAEAIREVGVLFVALAPLDAVFGPPSARTNVASLFFILLGISFFIIGLMLERRNGV